MRVRRTRRLVRSAVQQVAAEAMAVGLHRTSLTKGRGKASLVDDGDAVERLPGL
ncbi:hypothetical protein RISK_005079 [Rhodopirellula islandica]|uniref:Uncharacterized protein n=1 Tax=Rhodopirellula islandica TaxID=595434 RepID=A0A0J1B888_RHOIS|nr:hypothetical protein RISK_005079 [Rhodopirellula islandica]